MSMRPPAPSNVIQFPHLPHSPDEPALPIEVAVQAACDDDVPTQPDVRVDLRRWSGVALTRWARVRSRLRDFAAVGDRVAARVLARVERLCRRALPFLFAGAAGAFAFLSGVELSDLLDYGAGGLEAWLGHLTPAAATVFAYLAVRAWRRR